MSKPPAAVEKRLKAAVPKFQKILSDAKKRDINEADTVMIISDMMEEVFGMDKYSDITREHCIKGTYVDLAIVVDGTLDYLIEVKAIGIELKDSHVRQAVDYAAKEGVRWVVLTNGINWQIHRVTVDQKVKHENIFSFSFIDLNVKKQEDLELIFLLCKRGLHKDLIQNYYEKKQSVNRYIVGAILGTEGIASAVRSTMRKMTPGLKVDNDEIMSIIQNEVIKRDLQESESGIQAQKDLKRYLARESRKKTTPNVATPA